MTTGEFKHLTGVPIPFLFHCLFLKQPAVPSFIAVSAIKPKLSGGLSGWMLIKS